MDAVPRQERTYDMISGTFISTDRGFIGEIRSFGVREKVELHRIAKASDKAPDFRIHPADDERIDYGVAWQKVSKEGRDYISLKLTPLAGEPIYLRLHEPGEYGLVSSN